ncbi:CAP domain-containing protein [Sphingomonas sp. Leaf412]|uniref:CAP domain-containing protein n=1 Tax=Sphingomonas sp. Leaf412 TaxID=1736370 RepID=UPI002AA2B650|nr:CAP domain-containing protein [Sphingomonas sp. Leaf412]
MRARCHVAVLSILLSGAAGAQERVVERAPVGPRPARGTAPLRAAMIAGHDRARDAVGVPRLRWDPALAAAAQDYAQELARTGRFQHSVRPLGAARQGENLFTGTRGDYSYAEVVGLWLAERRDFVNRPAPGFSRTGRAGDVTHYAQIVWRATTAFGCAAASNARDDYVVCRYAPTGNVAGERAY